MNLLVFQPRKKPQLVLKRGERWLFLEETTFFRGDRYEARLLGRDDDPYLPHNRAMALRRLN